MGGAKVNRTKRGEGGRKDLEEVGGDDLLVIIGIVEGLFEGREVVGREVGEVGSKRKS